MEKIQRFAALSALFMAILPGGAWAGTLKVITTTPDLADIVRQVGGNKVKVESLGYPRQNPHFVDAKPSLILKLMKADLFIETGMELEAGWAPLLVQSSGNKNIQKGAKGFMDASQNIARMEIPANPDRSMGDVHPQGNPHYLLDPENVRLVARAIVEKLSSLLTEDPSYFKIRLSGFEAKLSQAMKNWTQALEPFKGQKFVSYHKVYPYFAARFGLVQVGEIEPKPGIPPTASHTADVMGTMKSQNVKLILTEPWYEGRTPETIAAATGAHVVVMAMFPGAADGAPDYLSMMDRNVRLIQEALSGK